MNIRYKIPVVLTQVLLHAWSNQLHMEHRQTILSRVGVTIDGVWIGLLDLLHLIHSQLGTTANTGLLLIYTLNGSPFTRTRVLSLLCRILATDLSVSLQLQITHEVFLSQSESFIAISSQSPWTAIFRTRPNSWQQLSVSLLTRLNTSLQPLCTDHAENTASILKEACLLIRCLGVDVLLLRALAPAAMCLPSRCLAVDLYITIWTSGWTPKQCKHFSKGSFF
jgi:hypothetical protein